MLDRKLIRNEADRVRQAVSDKRESADLDAILELDREHLGILKEVEELKSQRNTASEAISRMKKAGEDAEAHILDTRKLSERIKELDGRRAELSGAFECAVSLEEGIRRAAEHVRRRLDTFEPDAARHALLDRVAADQQALGA